MMDDIIHHVEKQGTSFINNSGGMPIHFESVYHVLGLEKNLLSVENAIDLGMYVWFGLNDDRFIQNIKIIKMDVITSVRE